MNFLKLIKNKLMLTAVLLPTVISAAAQDAAQNAPKEESSNLLAILLVIISIVLAIVIWGMGQALVGISKLAMEKQRKMKSAMGILLLFGFCLLSQSGFAQGTAGVGADVAKDLPNYGGLSAHNFYAFVGVILVEVAAIFFLAFSIRRVYQELLPENAPAKESKLREWWSSLDKKFFTKAVSVEKEADVMLDHDYDGIRELDNALPPWWKYGFYITIAVAFVYIFYFHVSGAGKNPTQEYAAEMENARIEKEMYEASNKDKIDESKVPMADAGGIANGQKLFEANCVACHLKGGAGNVGPNLTDDYWLHKGSLNDIFKTIKNGYPDKGMQAWDKSFNPKEISQIASYIKTLRGTNPPGAKAPQGDLYTEEAGPAASDSTAAAAPAVKTDSAATAKAGK
jgi:cytochrome c oxidase cbb3-type subunit 3